MQLKIKKFFNNYIRSLQFTKNLLIQLNILEEFKQISKYIQKSVFSFKLVWTKLKLYFKFYSL